MAQRSRAEHSVVYFAVALGTIYPQAGVQSLVAVCLMKVLGSGGWKSHVPVGCLLH